MSVFKASGKGEVRNKNKNRVIEYLDLMSRRTAINFPLIIERGFLKEKTKRISA